MAVKKTSITPIDKSLLTSSIHTSIINNIPFESIYSAHVTALPTMQEFVLFVSENVVPLLNRTEWIAYFIKYYTLKYEHDNHGGRLQHYYLWSHTMYPMVTQAYSSVLFELSRAAFHQFCDEFLFVPTKLKQEIDSQIISRKPIHITYPFTSTNYCYGKFLEYWLPKEYSLESLELYIRELTEELLKQQYRIYFKDLFSLIFNVSLNTMYVRMPTLTTISKVAVLNKDFQNGYIYETKTKRRKDIIGIDGQTVKIQEIVESWQHASKTQIDEWLNSAAEQFLRDREKFAVQRVLEKLYRIKTTDSIIYSDGAIYGGKEKDYLLQRAKEVGQVVREELVARNKHFSIVGDRWILYAEYNNALQRSVVSFKGIPYPLNAEIQAIITNAYSLGYRHHMKYSDCCNMLRQMCNLDNTIKSMEDISEEKIYRFIASSYKEGYKGQTIRLRLNNLRWILDEWIELKKSDGIIKHNPAKNISIRNSHHNIAHTETIPAEVRIQLFEHREELSKSTQIILQLLYFTGERFSDPMESYVTDVIAPDDSGNAIFRFAPSKTKDAKIAVDKYEIYSAPIPADLYAMIVEYIHDTEDIRKRHGTDKLFVNENNRKQLCNISTRKINNDVNALIKKYNITTLNGALWHFTTKQLRKSGAADLISAGAPLIQVQSFLHHSTQFTTEVYYAEVKREKLLEKNTEFFRQKFKLHIDPETYASLSDEDRAALYLDFLDKHREVELGVCCRKMSDGPCKSLGHNACATCTKLVTGSQFLDKWQALLDDSTSRIAQLQQYYQSSGIEPSEYEQFREYDREIKLFQSYKAVVTAITQMEVL